MDKKLIEEMRNRLAEVQDRFTVEDFKRAHTKFFGCLVSVEGGFKRRFPKEWAEYEKDFYGEEDNVAEPGEK